MKKGKDLQPVLPGQPQVAPRQKHAACKSYRRFAFAGSESAIKAHKKGSGLNRRGKLFIF